jgi:hypothetical protein
VHGLILSVKFALSSEQQLLITQLRKLVGHAEVRPPHSRRHSHLSSPADTRCTQCAEVESRKHDFDVIETNLDNTMRNVLQQVHGMSVLEPEVRQKPFRRAHLP